MIAYCSGECQRGHWKLHKTVCKETTKRLQTVTELMRGPGDDDHQRRYAGRRCGGQDWTSFRIKVLQQHCKNAQDHLQHLQSVVVTAKENAVAACEPAREPACEQETMGGVPCIDVIVVLHKPVHVIGDVEEQRGSLECLPVCTRT